MELAREGQDGIVTTPLGAARTGDGSRDHAGAQPPCRSDSEAATLILRRCTALAARARVDLLSPGRCEAAEELVGLLGQIPAWEPAALDPPDPTMTVLAAAALQDLVERLRLAAPQQESSLSALPAAIDAALSVLQEIMAGARADVPA